MKIEDIKSWTSWSAVLGLGEYNLAEQQSAEEILMQEVAIVSPFTADRSAHVVIRCNDKPVFTASVEALLTFGRLSILPVYASSEDVIRVEGASLAVHGIAKRPVV